MKRVLFAFFLAFPTLASAQYYDGLPLASSVSPNDIFPVCQGGTAGRPGTCTTRRAPISLIQSGIASATPVTGNGVTNTLGTWTGYLAGLPNPNPVTFGTTGFGTTTITPIGNSIIPTAAQVENSLTTNASGGISGTVGSVQNNHITINGAPNSEWWAELNQIFYGGTGGTGTEVAGYNQAVRFGFSSTNGNPSIWGSISENDDFTGQPSSALAPSLSVELDLTGHNVDNANNRVMAGGVIAAAHDNTNAYEASKGYSLQVGTGGYVKEAVWLAGPYTNALMDFRFAISYAQNATSLTAIGVPTVTAPVTASVTVPVSNVMPFTSDLFGRDINAGSFTTTVHFSDGQSATEIAYAVIGSGATPSGTLTLSAPITETSGNSVYNSSNAIWLPTGLTIALDTNGVTKISSDATTITLGGAIKVAGGTTMPLTTPSSSSATCAAGGFAIDANFVYVCTATNTWKRAALSSF